MKTDQLTDQLCEVKCFKLKATASWRSQVLDVGHAVLQRLAVSHRIWWCLHLQSTQQSYTHIWCSCLPSCIPDLLPLLIVVQVVTFANNITQAATLSRCRQILLSLPLKDIFCFWDFKKTEKYWNKGCKELIKIWRRQRGGERRRRECWGGWCEEAREEWDMRERREEGIKTGGTTKNGEYAQ